MKTTNKIIRTASSALAALAFAAALSVPTFATVSFATVFSTRASAAEPELALVQQASIAADISEENGQERYYSDKYARAYVAENGDGYIVLNKDICIGQQIDSIGGVPLCEIIQFNNGARVYSFAYEASKDDAYEYAIHVKGHGAQGLTREGGRLTFTDDGGDTYEMDVLSQLYGDHYLDYDSDTPRIVRIAWHA